MVWLCLAASACPASGAPLTACAEPSSGPPWLYALRDAAGRPTPELAGFTADIVRQAFASFDRQIQIRGDLPLIRCREMVAAGTIDFGIGFYYDAERARQFAYSAPYKVLTPQIFFSASRPIVVRKVEDLARYRGCGMHGWSYAHYGLSDTAIDKGTTSYRALVEKLKLGRCDYFPEELEVLSTQVLGKDSYLNDPTLLHVSIAGAIAPSKHLVAAKDGEAALLLPKFNAALAAMIKSGAFMALWKKNAGELPF
ncbi:MAG: transporter substrate-binding domain-containing protein [Pseudomonadota bacterium]